MNSLTNYISERAWEDTITAWYVHVDDAYQRVMHRHPEWQRQSGPEPNNLQSDPHPALSLEWRGSARAAWQASCVEGAGWFR